MLSKENCIEMGGHCWQDSGLYYSYASPGALRQGKDICKHCNAVRLKTEQPEWKYEEL